MPKGGRRLNRLEKLVALGALAAACVLGVAYAEAAGPKRKAPDPSDPLRLRSAVAYVQDMDSGETLYAKNSDQAMPIASITKLMTAMVILDRGLDLEQRVVVSGEDRDALKGTGSRLKPGAVLTRDELLLLSLMASENRAAASLARTYPGGPDIFIVAMNAKAKALGMNDTRFVDPTGLSSGNVSSARDLAKLVAAAHQYPLIREYSTRDSARVKAYGRTLSYHNTNGLVRNRGWQIGLSKTGYISEAGRCLVMRVHMASKDLVVVLLDSWGKYSRVGDAQRIRKWLETSAPRGPQG